MTTLGKVLHAVLPSNKGHESVSIEFRAPAPLAGEPGFDVAVSIETAQWSSYPPQPCRLTIDGIRLRQASLSALHRAISKWVELPLDEQAAEELFGEFELGIRGQSVIVRFGPRHDLIAERHPVVTIEIKAGRLQLSAHFAADQSCLRSFADDLVQIVIPR